MSAKQLPTPPIGGVALPGLTQSASKSHISIKSSIASAAAGMSANQEAIKASLDQVMQRSANKLYGEEQFTIEAASDTAGGTKIEILFSKELPQTPMVFCSIESKNECPVFHFITERSNKGFSVCMHNMSQSKSFDGTLLWFAFVQP